MIFCEQDGCHWAGFVSELPEHEYIEHGIGDWGGPDCTRCGGAGEVLGSRVARWDGEEDWRICRTCNGRGFAV